MELERDEVFEGQLIDIRDKFSEGFVPCVWCGNLLGPDYTIYRESRARSPHHFCNRDHATKWNDDRRRKFPGWQEEDKPVGMGSKICAACKRPIWSSGNMTISPRADGGEKVGLVVTDNDTNDIVFVLCETCTRKELIYREENTSEEEASE